MQEFNQETYKFIPIKIHTTANQIIQKLMHPLNPDGKSNTLTDLFSLVFQLASKTVIKQSLKENATGDQFADNFDDLKMTDKSDKTSEVSDDTSNQSKENSKEPTNSASVEICSGDGANYEKDSPQDEINRENLKKINYLVQGVKPPLTTPLLWLYSNLCYYDNFLHICVLNV